MGHWHLVSHDVAANKKIFVAMGGTPVTRGTAEGVRFPGARVNLNLGEEPPGKGGSVGSVVNHVGFIVNNVQEQMAKWKAAGVPVLPGNNNRLDQAFVETPDGVRIEILEDKTQAMPIQHEHVHFFLPEAEIPKTRPGTPRPSAARPGTRNNAAGRGRPGRPAPVCQGRHAAGADPRARARPHRLRREGPARPSSRRSRRRASSSTSRTARSRGPARPSPTSPIRGAPASSWSSSGCNSHRTSSAVRQTCDMSAAEWVGRRAKNDWDARHRLVWRQDWCGRVRQ